MDKKAGSTICFIFLLLILTSRTWANFPENIFLQSKQDATFIQSLKEAKAKLQAGINTWSADLLKEGRDSFLGILLKLESENVDIYYYVALADFRLATFYLAANNREETVRYIFEGQKYLEKAIELDPARGELFALYSMLLGYEIALYPERAISLGPKNFEYLSTALQKEPENPRVNLFQGISLFYTPEAYGGGVDRAINFLEKSISLFEKENIDNPLKPSWGKEEAYSFLAQAHIQKKEYEKAEELLRKALEINPEFGLARQTLENLKKIREK